MLAAGILNLLLLKEEREQQTKMGLNLIFTHSDGKQGSMLRPGTS